MKELTDLVERNGHSLNFTYRKTTKYSVYIYSYEQSSNNDILEILIYSTKNHPSLEECLDIALEEYSDILKEEFSSQVESDELYTIVKINMPDCLSDSLAQKVSLQIAKDIEKYIKNHQNEQ